MEVTQKELMQVHSVVRGESWALGLPGGMWGPDGQWVETRLAVCEVLLPGLVPVPPTSRRSLEQHRGAMNCGNLWPLPSLQPAPAGDCPR